MKISWKGLMPTLIDTATYRAADAILAGRLASHLRSWRRKGWSGERMSRELYLTTGGAVDVTGQTIRQWLRKFEEAK